MNKLAQRFTQALVLFTATLLGGCSTYTLVRSSASLSRFNTHATTVVVLPPSVEVVKSGMSGGEKVEETYSYALETPAREKVAELLRGKGFKVQIAQRVDLHKAGLLHTWDAVRESYKAHAKELYSALLDKDKAHSINKRINSDATSKLGKAFGADLLIVSDYKWTTTDSGSRVAGFMVSMWLGSSAGQMPADMFDGLIGLVDAKSGEILWMNKGIGKPNMYFADSGGEEADARRIEEVLTNALKELPVAS